MNDKQKLRKFAVFAVILATLITPISMLYMVFVMRMSVDVSIFGSLVWLVVMYVFALVIYFWKGPIK